MSPTNPRSTAAPFLVRLALAATLLVLLPLSARGQVPGSLAGRVLSQAELLPLAGARVSLEATGERVTTDADGGFHLSAVPPGAAVIRVEHDGYISLVESVAIASLELTLVQFQLSPISALLDELFVVADQDESGRRSDGASEAEISGRSDDGARTATDLLINSVPGMTLVRSGGSTGGGVRVRLRGVSSITLSDDPSVYLDGVRIDDGGGLTEGGLGSALNVLDQIPAGDVKRIRILRGPASAAGYANSAAGVILVETVRSRSPERSR